MTLIDDGYLDEPPPPRRSGCLSVLSFALLLAIALGTAPGRALPSIATGSQPSIVQPPRQTSLTMFAPLGRSDQGNPDPPPVTSRIAAIVPSGSVGTALIGGWATFYADPSQRIDHYAAAGPLLRDALGHWRGKVIRVTSGNRSTIVQLADFCACGERHGLPTLLDLSPEAFRDLASLSAGIVRVEIELVELPATDALPRNAADLRMQAEVRGDELYEETP